MSDIEIYPVYTATEIKSHFESANGPFSVHVFGDRRSGVTTTLVHTALAWATSNPNQNILYTCNHSSTAVEIILYMKRIIEKHENVEYNSIMQKITFENGSVIYLRNSNTGLSEMKAVNIDLVIIDGAKVQPKTFVDTVKTGWIAKLVVLGDTGETAIRKCEVDIQFCKELSPIDCDKVNELLKLSESDINRFVKNCPVLTMNALRKYLSI